MDFINTCYETTNEVRSLALYSHLLPVFAGVILGWFVYKFAQNRVKGALFLSFVILLSLWLLGDLITWHSNNYFAVAGFWSVLDFINILFFLYIFYFIIIDFFDQKKLSIPLITVSLLMVAFPFMLTVSGISVLEFDEPNCEMYEAEILGTYKFVFENIIILSILIAGIIAFIKRRAFGLRAMRVGLMTGMTVLFLLVFSTSEYIATITDIYEINLYALFTLPIFLLFLTYSIIEQGTFTFKVDSITFAKLLFFIFVLVGVSNLILADDYLELLTTGATTIVTLGFAVLLLRSASREAKQRIQIEELAKKLERANKRLKVLDQLKSEFVSIASHQLRSPLTAIRGYTSMLLEGSYGKLPKKTKDVVAHIADSSRLMALSIEDYLNVSRIESGNMKYNATDFNLKELASNIVDDLRQAAVKKGLVLTFKSDINRHGVVNADLGKTQQILHNLIDNAMKYTKKGTIEVKVYEKAKSKMIHVDVKDTGVGMSEETMESLFEKFIRAKNAHKVNISGTGLGLYVARKMAQDMGGDVTARSEGEGKGSTFTLTLPLHM